LAGKTRRNAAEIQIELIPAGPVLGPSRGSSAARPYCRRDPYRLPREKNQPIITAPAWDSIVKRCASFDNSESCDFLTSARHMTGTNSAILGISKDLLDPVEIRLS
jgi:hypothetical protein